MFVFQFHLCEEKAGKHDVVYFREYWIFCHLRQRSRISSERQYTGLRKSVSPPCDSFMNKKMTICWKCFQVIGDEASKDEWVRDVCHFRRVSKTDSMPRPPPSNSPPPDSTQITTFKSEAAKVLSAPPPWSDQKLVTDKINFHFSSYGRVWSSGS